MANLSPESLITDGAKDALKWLRRKGYSATRFCRTKGLDRIEFQRVLSGEKVRISVDFALDICRAMDGDVRLERFAHSREVRELLFEQRSRARRRVRGKAA